MNGIRQLAVRLAELAEAEGRVFKEHIDRLLQRVVLLLAAAVVAMGGLVVLVVGVYMLLAKHMGAGPAAMIVGLAMILLGGVLFALSTVFAGNLPSDPRKK